MLIKLIVFESVQCIYFISQFLAEDFLGYIDAWRAGVMGREGFTKAEKNKMFLTQQTYDGLRTTGTCVSIPKQYVGLVDAPAIQLTPGTQPGMEFNARPLARGE